MRSGSLREFLRKIDLAGLIAVQTCLMLLIVEAALSILDLVVRIGFVVVCSLQALKSFNNFLVLSQCYQNSNFFYNLFFIFFFFFFFFLNFDIISILFLRSGTCFPFFAQHTVLSTFSCNQKVLASHSKNFLAYHFLQSCQFWFIFSFFHCRLICFSN